MRARCPRTGSANSSDAAPRCCATCTAKPHARCCASTARAVRTTETRWITATRPTRRIDDFRWYPRTTQGRHPLTDALLCYCRAGFEPELAAELSERAATAGHPGYARNERGRRYGGFHRAQ